MDAAAVPVKGEAVAFATAVVVTKTTGIAMVPMPPPTTPGTLERQTRGGRRLLLRREVISLIDLFVHCCPVRKRASGPIRRNSNLCRCNIASQCDYWQYSQHG